MQIDAAKREKNRFRMKTNYNPQEEGSCRWKINLRYLINLDVGDGIYIDEINSGQRDLKVSIQRQSHIRLFPEEYQLAFSRLQQKREE